MAASAACFAVLGLLLLFAPEDVSGLLEREATGHGLVQLLGAALLGFAALNWIDRGAALGSIYGRAVVADNQTHLTIGAILLVKRGAEVGSTRPAFWALTGPLQARYPTGAPAGRRT